jgi:uncharacterized damage-inducible protein DinB
MPTAVSTLVAELNNEFPITRRVLERVPADKLAWQPHAKSMSLGQLAQHVALIPGNMARLSQQDGVDMATRKMEYASGESAAAILTTFDASVSAALSLVGSLDDAAANAPWRMTFGEREVFAVPRIAMLRTMLLHHMIHHRGELVVYLRLLDVPVPVVYGKSADENPFVPATATV